MKEVVAGYKVEKLEDGTTELVEPSPAWSAGCIGVMWGSIGVLWAFLTPRVWQAGMAGPVLLVLLFAVPVAAMVLPCLRWLILERRWLIRCGEIASRPRVRAVGAIGDSRFRAVLRVEIRHGVWRPGPGCTDVLRLYVDGARRPTALAARETDGGSEVNATVLDLGRLVAFRAGRKLEVVTKTIWRLPSPGE